MTEQARTYPRMYPGPQTKPQILTLDKHRTQERFLSTSKRLTNRLKMTKVSSNSQVKPQNYDPVLSKFYEHYGIIIPHPLQNGEEDTVLRGSSNNIPLLTKNVRPNKRPTSKNFFKSENRGACNLKWQPIGKQCL